MVLTDITILIIQKIEDMSRNPLLIGSMVLTLWTKMANVAATDGRNPLLIGSMVLTEKGKNENT